MPKFMNILDGFLLKISFCDGILVWNDYDLCFSIEDLYSGLLMHVEGAESMVAEASPEYRVKSPEQKHI